MSLHCSRLGFSLPRLVSLSSTTYVSTHVDTVFFLSNPKPVQIFSKLRKIPSCCHYSSSIMNTQEEKLDPLTSCAVEEPPYSKELEAAVRAVQMACSLCQKVQKRQVFDTNGLQSEENCSPVTVADWSVRATVSWVLSLGIGAENVKIITDEDSRRRWEADSRRVLHSVLQNVNDCLAEAHRFGFPVPSEPLSSKQVVEAINRCNSTGSSDGRFWALDPLNGTPGFLHGDQYAVALALIDKGDVAVGVLGCPNYPIGKEWRSYQPAYRRIVSELSDKKSDSWKEGCVMYAGRGSNEAWMQPLVKSGGKLVWPNSARRVRTSSVEDPAFSTFCKPVEKYNTTHSFAAGIARSVGHRKEALGVNNMVKYMAVARGDAEVFMKFGRAGHKEKTRDHAAGFAIVREAGGVVTDARGCPVDFSDGVYLKGLDRGLVVSAGKELHGKVIEAIDASWSTSCL